MTSRIINSTYITLDGGIENPHLLPSLDDDGAEAGFEIQNELLQSCDALLMGRKTYESFASVWPTRSDTYSDRINSMRKYVVSSTLKNPSWTNTTVINSDVADQVAALKCNAGRDIVQYGLGEVSFLLMQRGLIDELRLWFHPLILGTTGPAIPPFLKCPPSRLQLAGTRTLPNGIAILTYSVRAPA